MNITRQTKMLGLALAIMAALFASDARAELKHRYSFTDSAADSVNGADGELVNNTGNATYSDGQLVMGNDGTQNSGSDAGDYVDLPNGIISDLVGANDQANFTMEVWFTWTGAGDWQRVWDMGTSVGGEDVSDSGDLTAQLFTTPQAGGGGVRAAWRGQGGGETSVTRQPSASANEEHHLAFVWDEANTTATMYVDGVNAGENTATAITIANDVAGNDVNNWLGRSQWAGDNLFVGSYNEFRIYDNALSADDVASNFFGGADSTTGGSLDDMTGLSASTDAVSLVQGETAIVSAVGDFGGRSLNVTPFVSASSNNANVATIDSDGTITGVGAGEATITFANGASSASIQVSVAVPPLPEAVLRHRYSFSDGSGSDSLSDSVGDKNGVAYNVTFNSNGTADFVGEDLAYVDLPNGMISDLGDNATVEAWATFDPAGQGGWQRVFDFGNTTAGEDPDAPQAGGAGYNGEATWFFAPRRGGIGGADGGRTAFDPGVGGGENPTLDIANGNGIVPGEEFHLVVTYNHTQRNTQVWINGINVAETAVLPDRPMSSLDDVNNWIGRSQWGGDAFTTANYNEFRIFEGVLSPVQIAVNDVTGPDEIIDDPGAATSINLTASDTDLVAGGLPANLSLKVDFENVSGVDLSSSTLATFESSDSRIVRILTAPLRVIPIGEGSATVTANLDGQTQNITFNVAAAGDTPQLAHRYEFDGDANDSAGDADGQLIGEGTFENGGLSLDGSGFVDLPDYLFSEYYLTAPIGGGPALTFEIFGHWNGGGAWQRLLDFGDNTFGEEWPIPAGTSYNGTGYMQITPSSGAGQLFAEVINDGVTPTLQNPAITGPGLAAGQDFYVAFVLDPANDVARLYRNGELVGIQAVSDEQDFSAIEDFNVWLGRSNFSADPGFNGTFTDFRIWEGALQEADIALHAVCGPDALDCDAPTPFVKITGSSSEVSEPTVVDFGNLGGDATYVFHFNAVMDGASTAIAGNDAFAIKLDQWNNQGVFGTTEFGVADNLFEAVDGQSVASVFDSNVHVIIVSDSGAGESRLYINGTHSGTWAGTFDLSGSTKIMGARLEQATDHMGAGSVMYEWATYAGIPSQSDIDAIYNARVATPSTVILSLDGVPATGSGLDGRYWQAAPASVPSLAEVGLNIIHNWTPNGTFTATGLSFQGGNDLTTVQDWLQDDGASYVGTDGNMDDGVLSFTGYIRIDSPGTVDIRSESDDGSIIWIAGEKVVDNDGSHGAPGPSPDGSYNFEAAGLYPIEIAWFNGDWTSDAGDHGGANLNILAGGNAVPGEILYSASDVNAAAIGVSSLATEAGDAGLHGAYWTTEPKGLEFGEGAQGPIFQTVPGDDHGLMLMATPPQGRFISTDVNYTGDDLTPILDWLGNDGGSFVGEAGNFDDGLLQFKGFINITEAGQHSFNSSSDDGSVVRIGNQVVVNNDGGHGAPGPAPDGNAFFPVAGLYPIEVAWFNGDWTSADGAHGGANINLTMDGASLAGSIFQPLGGLPPVGPSANIAFVSFHETDEPSAAAADAGMTEAADIGYTDALKAAGHTVTRILTSGSPDVELLNTFDLVIISRSVSSGGYSSGDSADAWNSVSSPMLVLGGYVLRTSRMGYTDGTTMVDTADTIQLRAEDASHPLFSGVDLTDGVTGDFAGIVTWNDQVQRGVSINNNNAGEAGRVIATVATESDPTAGGIVAIEYDAGAPTTTGGNFAGKRMALLTGSREAGGVTSETAGIWDLTDVGRKIYLNAVSYLTAGGSGGGISGVSLADGMLTIEYSGTLKSAGSVTGPFNAVDGASSPYTVAADQAAQFFIAE